MPTWRSGSHRTDYVRANAEMVGRAVGGFGPDPETNAVGARVVVNIPNVHVPAFCAASASGRDSRPYKNKYDLACKNCELAMIVGDPPPKTVNKRRETVDRALPLTHPIKDVYFGAMELNGAGVRFTETSASC